MTKPMSAKNKAKILICKDVLKLLESKKIKSKRSNTYLQINYNKNSFTTQEISLKKLLTDTKSCTVCVLGSLLVAHTLKYNKININKFEIDYDNQSHIQVCEIIDQTLIKYFSVKELEYIEMRFEHDKQSIKFIMEDIIKNKGIVNPDKWNAQWV